MSYTCQRCLKNFPSKFRLLRHLKGKRECKVVSNGEDIDRETLINNTETKLIHQCNTCGKKCRSTLDLERHEKYCYGDMCIWDVPFLYSKKYLGYKKLERILVAYIKVMYLNPEKPLIRIQQHNSYLIYEKSNWIKIGKYQLMSKIFLKFSEFENGLFSIKSRNMFSNIGINVNDHHSLNKFENNSQNSMKMRFFFKVFYEVFHAAVANPSSVLTYKQYIKNLETQLEAIEKEVEDIRMQEKIRKDIEKSKNKEELKAKQEKILSTFINEQADQVFKYTLELSKEDSDRRFMIGELATLVPICCEHILKRLENETKINVAELTFDIQNYRNL